MTDMHDSDRVVVQLEEWGVVGEAYNIGSGVAVSVRDVLNIAVGLSTREDIRLEVDDSRVRLYDEKVLLSDNTKIRNLIGWTPKPGISRPEAPPPPSPSK